MVYSLRGCVSMTLKLKTEPMSHQVEALDFLISRKFGALYTAMGSGKTKVMIDLINNSDMTRVLVVCPTKVCREWVDEFSKHSYEDIPVIDLQAMTGDSKVSCMKQMQKSKKKLVFVINYENVWRPEVKSQILKMKFDTVICDESHKIKGAGSKCSMTLHLIGKKATRRYIMTGTPLASSPLDIYAQYRFLDSRIFGTNFMEFKYQYANFIHRDGYDVLDKKNPYKNLDELHHKMFSCAYMTKEEDLDIELPDTTWHIKRFSLEEDCRKMYDKIKKDGCIIFDNMDYVEASNILATGLRLQQLTSGFTKIERAKNGLHQAKTKKVSVKREICLEKILQKTPAAESKIVFYRFKRDKNRIARVCEKIGSPVFYVDGGTDEVEEWKKCKNGVLVAQIQSCAEGLNLTHARICIYYSLHSSLALWEQSKKRIHRIGQTKRCVYYVILAKDTIDEIMYDALINKKELIDYILDCKNFS